MSDGIHWDKRTLTALKKRFEAELSNLPEEDVDDAQNGFREGLDEGYRLVKLFLGDEEITDAWIDVNDEMPEENVAVLVFIPAEDNHITAGMWDVSQKWVLLDDYRVVPSEESDRLGDGEPFPNSIVTHWMPLPPLPESPTP